MANLLLLVLGAQAEFESALILERRGRSAALAYFGEFVGQRDGSRHQLGGLVAGIAEHHALIAGAALVNALSDIARLLVDGGNDRTGVGVKAVQGVVVAD